MRTWGLYSKILKSDSFRFRPGKKNIVPGLFREQTHGYIFLPALNQEEANSFRLLPKTNIFLAGGKTIESNPDFFVTPFGFFVSWPVFFVPEPENMQPVFSCFESHAGYFESRSGNILSTCNLFLTGHGNMSP